MRCMYSEAVFYLNGDYCAPQERTDWIWNNSLLKTNEGVVEKRCILCVECCRILSLVSLFVI